MDYNLLVIGAGPGGYEAAIRASQLGMKTALIEKGEVGGTCLNRGCIPTKALLHAQGNFAEMMAQKEEAVTTLRSGVEMLLNKNKITVIKGEARIEKTHHVSVNGEMITADHILCATGSVPQRPPIKGLENEGVMTSDELLSLSQAPKSLVIIGGGVIGVEFATVFLKQNSAVTIIEAMERILPPMDREISQNLSMILKKQGAAIHTGAMVQRIEKTDDGLAVVFEEKQQEKRIACDKVLVATGRRANVANVFAQGLLPETERGFLRVNDRYATSIESVYAIGDAIGGMMLAHEASAEGIAAVEMLAGVAVSHDLSTIPACVYTSPEIASVGLTQDEAKAQDIETVVGKYIMGGNGRTVIEKGQRGFIKVVARKDNGVIVGAQLMCERATDMIGEITTAIVNGLSYHQLARGVRPHPTFNEGLLEALHAIDGTAIHIMPAR